MGDVELHFHLLPGLDDGPVTIEDSLALAAAAAAEGTRTIVATPHVNRLHVADVSVLPDAVAEVAAAMRHAAIPIRVHCGAELAHERVGRLSQSELEIIAQGPRGRRWLLLEAPLDGMTDDFTLAADELRERGFALVIAHPERSLAVRPAGRRILQAELEAGSALQLNAWSLAGRYGDGVRMWAQRLLDAVPHVVVASDAHGSARPPALAMARSTLRAIGDVSGARRCAELPRALLEHGLRAQAPAVTA